MEQGIQRIDYRLLQGCCLEAERADIISVSLEGLRMALPEAYGGTITSLVDEIRRSARKLRDLADLSQMHFTRVPILLNYLDVILPCYCKTLRDITEFYEDRTDNQVERSKRTPHANNSSRACPSTGDYAQTNTSGSEQIFSLPLTSRTALKHIRPSTAYGPFQTWGQLNIPKQVKMLFRRPFDEDRLALMTYLNHVNQTPYFLLRTYHLGGQWFSLLGAHELCIRREGSALLLDRYSHSQMGLKLWASLYFKTWEELVLFHCTFVSLKARIILTSRMSPREFKLGSESRLFQAQILDDGFKHSLIVYRDLVTQGLRLQASVWDGELKNCPVWTAFVTHQSASPTWLVRKSDHRIWLKDVQLYVFCQQYHQQNQRKGSSAGAFEIDFVSEMGATRFIEEIQSQVDPSEASTDTMEAIEDAR
ncbi:hypothetical protein CaCOL14_013325 [Colletotrichum acutatum]